MKRLLFAVFALIAWGFGQAYAKDPASVGILEDIAVQYISAFNRGEYEEVVSLMHPEAIKNTSRMFIKEYEKAISEGRGAAFRKDLIIDKDITEIRKMEESDIVVYILKSNRNLANRSNRAASERMMSVVVKTAGKERIDEDTYRVKFIMFLPGDSGSAVRNGEVILSRINGAWRVYR